MPELQRLRPDHASAVLAFEKANRAFFAASVPDRGDAFFTDYRPRHEALLTEQATGTCHFHVLVDSSGEILGRFNLMDAAPAPPNSASASRKRPRAAAWRRPRCTSSSTCAARGTA